VTAVGIQDPLQQRRINKGDLELPPPGPSDSRANALPFSFLPGTPAAELGCLPALTASPLKPPKHTQSLRGGGVVI